MKLLIIHIRYWAVRLIAALAILLFLFIVYFFKISELNIYGYHIINPLFQYTAPLEIWLYLLVYFIFVFIFNTVFLSILTVAYKLQNKRTDRIKVKYEKLFAETITTYLTSRFFKQFDEAETSLNILKKRYNHKIRNVMIDVLRKVHSEVIGDMRNDANELIYLLKFDELVLSYLYSPYLDDKILALQTISDFQLKGQNSKIMKLAVSKNYLLRSEALISSIKLSIFDDITFNNKRRWNITKLDMNNILLITNQFKNHNINIEQLIISEFPRVAALGVLLANEHKRTDLKEAIKLKIGNENDVLHHEALLSFISMSTDLQDYNFLKQIFSLQNRIDKQAIIEAFNNCPDKETGINFYLDVIDNEELALKTTAMKLLLEVAPNKLNTYSTSENMAIVKAYKHAIDFNII